MYGGAIYNSGNNLIVKNSKFNGNYIYGYTDSMNKHVDLSDKYGGAVYSNADISAFLNNEFDSNEIYSMLSSYVTKKVYLSNKGIASAIAAYNKVIIINNTFLNNSAACPPINIDNGERCIILNNTFINNNARSLAQSIKMDGNNTFIAGNTFYRDENAVDKGYFENPDYWEVYEILIDGGVNNTISYNYFENSNGIHYLNSFGEDKTANLTISNNVFNNSKKSVFVEHINNVDITSNVFINSNYAISTYTGRHINIKNNYFYGGGSDNSSHRGYLDINSHFTDISGNVFRKIGAEDSLGPVIYIKVRDNITIAENAFIENTVAHGNGIISSLFGGFYYIDGITDVDGPLGNVEVNHNYFANNSLNDSAIFESRASKINIENNIIENNEGLIILANETYYKTQYMNFTKNQIKDFTGDIMDYSYFYNSKNFDGSANEEYTGDSTSFLDKIFDFVKNLWDEYVKGKNSVKDPNNVDTNKNTTSSGSDVADNTDDSRDDIKSNSTDSSGDSDVGDSLDKSHYSAKNSLSESESNVGDSSSGLSSDSSSPEVHELEKSNVSKDIADDNYLIWIVLVIVVIFALLAIGYNKR